MSGRVAKMLRRASNGDRRTYRSLKLIYTREFKFYPSKELPF